jgi:hypothetical protein
MLGAGDGVIDQAREVVFSLWGDAGVTDLLCGSAALCRTVAGHRAL